jgi:hypothetical protein
MARSLPRTLATGRRQISSKSQPRAGSIEIRAEAIGSLQLHLGGMLATAPFLVWLQAARLRALMPATGSNSSFARSEVHRFGVVNLRCGHPPFEAVAMMSVIPG